MGLRHWSKATCPSKMRMFVQISTVFQKFLGTYFHLEKCQKIQNRGIIKIEHNLFCLIDLSVSKLLLVVCSLNLHVQICAIYSSVDKAHLRLASAKAVLRLSKIWDDKIPLDIFYLTLRTSEVGPLKIFLSSVCNLFFVFHIFRQSSCNQQAGFKHLTVGFFRLVSLKLRKRF